jgi:uncharacterized coiled-coil protein SlyX
LSLPRELERLQSRRAELETESHSLEEQQKDMENRVKMLEEKIAIQELKKGNKTRQETISQLKSKMDELEQRLKNTSEEPENPEPSHETLPGIVKAPEPKEEMMEVTEPTQEEPEEETVTVTALEDTMTVEQEETGEGFSRQHEKKKRRFL